MFDRFSEGDHLLRWASEIEAGTWSKFRDTAGYVASAHQIRQQPWVFAHRMSSLGHIDVDWSQSVWSVAPPVLSVSEGTGLVSLLAGWRPSTLTRRLVRWNEEGVMKVRHIRQRHDPTAVFIAHPTLDHLWDAATQIGAKVSFRPSSQLVDLIELQQLDASTMASPPMADEDLQYFEPTNFRWREAPHRDSEGLYSFDLYGRREFRLLQDGAWHKVDRATGQLTVLAGRDDVVSWHPQSPDCSTPRVLTIPRGLSLPAVAERAAVAACGLLPAVVGDRVAYRNVSRDDAARLCDGIGLELRVEKKALAGIPAIQGSL